MEKFELDSLDSHSAVYYKPENIVLIFGGYHNNAYINNYLSIIHVASKKLIIANDIIDSQFPDPRCDHSAVIIDHKMYIMGGKNIQENLQFNDLWMFDTIQYVWNQIITPLSN